MNRFVNMAHRHLVRLATLGTATGYGPDDNRMWMASVDTRTGRYPEDDSRPPGISKRCYRWIESPRGCNLYWDMPLIAAAHAVSALTGDASLVDAADAYVSDFLDRCVASNGLLLWGNHYYYDAFQGRNLAFTGSRPPTPDDPALQTGELHEARPLPPAWGALWRISPTKTEAAIRTMIAGHLFDPDTGGFNRHATRTAGCAFLEAGGILAESAAWLNRRVPAPDLVEQARKIARYSFSHRSEATGLLENNPTETRWDKHTATTEAGMWAGCLLQGADAVPEWRGMAADAVSAYLRHGFDKETGRFFGRLNVADGRPVMGAKTTEYQPDEYSDCWEPLFPAHDYPFQMAETCLDLCESPGGGEFEEGVRRWVGHIEASLPPRGGKGGYAEHYGRAVHFLARAAEQFGKKAWRGLAEAVAQDAANRLWTGAMFRGHPGEDRCDAVDGVGCLLLALIRLETEDEPDMMGFHF